MKICIVSHEYPPNIISGCGTALNTLAKGLVKNGHEITIITPLLRTDKEREESKNLTIIRIPLTGSMILRILSRIDSRIAFSFALRKFKKHFTFTQFDILHVYDVHDSYFLNKKLTSVQTIISVNDYYAFITPLNIFKFPYPTPNKIKRYIHAMLTKTLNKMFLKKASLIIALTEYSKDVLRKKCNIAEKKIRVIYRGMEIKKFRQSRNKYTSMKILYIGSNMERKGVPYIIDAMPTILKTYPESHLTIIGKTNPALQKLLKEKIQNNKLQDKITIMEYIPSEKIPSYFEDANVFILPAIIENLAVTVLEAMSSKTPVVTTGVGGHEEAISSGSGILINPGSSEEISNAIIQIFSNPQKAKQMGENALKIIHEKFSQQRMIDEVDVEYQKLISQLSQRKS
ncbi:MAG TPA: glycosyltransferase family 4 protein [Candidatus Nanoarchaeia archaeon]|nr:glycosyltransferase family 4 protein [Candidatus Nanoarchaeia archaeon]